ncbi:hypothetical protein KP509_03G043600 [Ceratopteris richardii]|uniref:Sphingomyelin synthase-like domain-containing protein n=1 Tax=Ceratopteris richardii TaxID=49495 RepID=A0A8T2UZE5_CERRI|nr:hypothetical protein KP509_03G043600 [Ceratopteris richardii]
MYIARETSKVWRRITMEYSVEWPLLKERWKFLIFCLFFQYLHGLAARAVHYLHRPGPVLQDVGFMLLPELGPKKAYISETLFSFIFCSFLLWTFHPFIFHAKRFYTVLVWYRCLAVLVVSQCLRIASFMVTQLPGPNYHCREGSKMASLPAPKRISEVFLLNFPYGVVYGCGDLIFSSHMIFTLVFVRTYQKFGSKRWIKQLSWALAVVLSVLIVASRKHYTVDVVVAWYTVNLVFFLIDRQLPEAEFSERIPSGGGGGGLPLLPLSTKDSQQTKEELHKLINGNAAEAKDTC